MLSTSRLLAGFAVLALLAPAPQAAPALPTRAAPVVTAPAPQLHPQPANTDRARMRSDAMARRRAMRARRSA